MRPIICAAALLACAALAGPAQAQVNVQPVYGPGELTTTDGDWTYNTGTSFAPARIQPGQGFTYDQRVDLVEESFAGTGCSYDSESDAELELQPVAPGGTQEYYVVGATAHPTGTMGWALCRYSWGQRETRSYTIPGSSTAAVPPGCYQVVLHPFSIGPTSGTISTLAVGNGDCLTADQCNDSVSNDFDGLADALDPGCADGDKSEYSSAQCDNGADDNGNGQTDWPRDSGCDSALDTSESDPVTVFIDIEGPGAVNGCRENCRLDYERGTEVTFEAEPDEPKDGFLGWAGCDAAFGTSCHIRLDSDKAIEARFDPVVGYAPWMSYHPGEKWWPMSAALFVQKSALKWANIGSGKYRPCSSKKTVTIVKQGQIDARRLSAGGYEFRYCWRKKILGRLGKREWKTFDTRQLSSPSIKKSAPLVRSGFFLDLDNGARKGSRPRNDIGPPMYVEYRPKRHVIYWFFGGKNEVDWGKAGRDLHEGDWEHIAVKLDKANRATAVAYYQHLCGGDVHSWSKMRKSGWLYDGTHPKVYVALGAHASYPRVPRAGKVPLACIEKKWIPVGGLWDALKQGGTTWKTWSQGSDAFKRADAQPWYGFGGGWGSDAGSSPAHAPGPFWGPLGPGPLKGKDALPSGW